MRDTISKTVEKTRVAVHLIIDSRVVFLFSRTEQMRPVINTNRCLLQSTLPESARDICLVEAASSHLLKMSSNFNRLIGSHKFPGPRSRSRGFVHDPEQGPDTTTSGEFIHGPEAVPGGPVQITCRSIVVC